MRVMLQVTVWTLDNDTLEGVADFLRELLEPHMHVEVKILRATHEIDERGNEEED